MYCKECGADLPGEESCYDRFGALLSAERDEDGNITEAMDVHGLTVTTYYLQHAGGLGYTKRYMVDGAEKALRRIFSEGLDQMEVFPPNQRAARQREAAQAKAAPGPSDPITSVVGPLEGELTIASIDPSNMHGHKERIIVWAQSVAEHRVLSRDKKVNSKG